MSSLSADITLVLSKHESSPFLPTRNMCNLSTCTSVLWTVTVPSYINLVKCYSIASIASGFHLQFMHYLPVSQCIFLNFSVSLPQNILEEDVAEAQVSLSPNSGANSQSTGSWVGGTGNDDGKCSPNSDSPMGMENSTTSLPQTHNEESGRVSEHSDMVEERGDTQVKDQTCALSPGVENATCDGETNEKPPHEPEDETG